MSATLTRPAARLPHPSCGLAVRSARRIAARLDAALDADATGLFHEACIEATEILGGLSRDGVEADLDSALAHIRGRLIADYGDNSWSRRQIESDQAALAQAFMEATLLAVQGAAAV